MARLILLAAFVLVSASPVRGADLPTGTWSVAVNGSKGTLSVNEVGRDGKVKAVLLSHALEGVWDGTTLTLKTGSVTLEACLVSEEDGKGETKYTLTGFRVERIANLFSDPPGEYPVKSGWYAQKIVKDADQIKVEIKGTIVCKDTTSAYVSVKRDDGFGREQETRVYFWLSEGEWKYWRDVLPKLNGQTVTVTGTLGQIPKDTKTSIPEGAMFFQRGFVIKTATETFK
jgi:hypothetical protein